MKNLLKGFVMSASMFSVIPLPASMWNDKSMPYVMPFFPFVGVMIGGLWYLAVYILTRLTPMYIYASFLSAALIAICPFFLSGFIHADGLLDTADAVFSRRSRDEKIRILKDPHMGAFAAFALCVLMLLSFCAVMDIQSNLRDIPLTFVLLPVMSRCVAGLALLKLKSLSETGFAASFKAGTSAGHSAAIIAVMIVCVAAAFALGGTTFIPILATVLMGVITAAFLYRQFGGISGDICGAIITVSELAGLVCMAVCINLSGVNL